MKPIRILMYVVLFAIFFASCNTKTTTPTKKHPTKKYIVKAENAEKLSARIECDSVTMITQTEIIIWIDGREMKMIAPSFKIYDNPYFTQQ